MSFICRSKLDAKNLLIYDLIYSGLCNGNLEIRIPKIKNDEITKIVFNVISDNPSYWYIDTSKIAYTQYIDLIILRLNTIVPKNTIRSMNDKLEDQISYYIKAINDRKGSEIYSSVLAAYNLFMERIDYDYSLKGRNAFNAYGALAEEKAVCQGISQAFCLVLNKLGYNCSMVLGEAKRDSDKEFSGHSWCIVEIGNNYAHIDPTWDICTYSQLGIASYNYFLVDDTLLKNSHRWSLSDYPSCNGEIDDYFKINKLYAHTEIQLKNIIAKQLFRHQSSISIRISENLSYLLNDERYIIEQCLNIAANYNIDLEITYCINKDSLSFDVLCEYK